MGPKRAPNLTSLQPAAPESHVFVHIGVCSFTGTTIGSKDKGTRGSSAQVSIKRAWVGGRIVLF